MFLELFGSVEPLCQVRGAILDLSCVSFIKLIFLHVVALLHLGDKVWIVFMNLVWCV